MSRPASLKVPCQAVLPTRTVTRNRPSSSSLHAAGDKTKPHPAPQITGRETKPAGKIARVDEPVAVLVTIEAHRRYPPQGGRGCGVSAILPHRSTA